jgi:hypothetical protein
MTNELSIQLSDLLNKLWGITEAAGNIINSCIGQLPPDVQTVVQSNWAKLMDSQNEAKQSISGPLNKPGDLNSITQGALNWKTNVGDPCATAAYNTQDILLAVDDHWKGDGGDAYKKSIKTQYDALHAISTEYVAHIIAALNSVKTTVATFWTTVITAAVASTAAALIALATLPAVVTIAVDLLIILAALVAVLAAMITAHLVADNNIIAAIGELNGGDRATNFPGAKWPTLIKA